MFSFSIGGWEGESNRGIVSFHFVRACVRKIGVDFPDAPFPFPFAAGGFPFSLLPRGVFPFPLEIPPPPQPPTQL